MVVFSEVTKKYNTKAAVSNLSFELHRGEVLALLGPNGAGKSTSMKMMTGYFPPSAGNIEVCGWSLPEQATRAQQRVGYLPEGTPLYTEATVSEFLEFAAQSRDILGKDQTKAVDRVLGLCGLHSVKNQLIDTLSKGYRQRTCLAQSIIHDPDILVLDEPTDGLDPNQKLEIQEMIREMAESKSILLSTHIMEEAELMSDRILILCEGQKVALGTIQDLRDQVDSEQRLFLRLVSADSDAVCKKLESIPEVTKVELKERRGKEVDLVLWESSQSTSEYESIVRIVSFCQEQQWSIKEIRVLEDGLRDLFHRLTQAK